GRLARFSEPPSGRRGAAARADDGLSPRGRRRRGGEGGSRERPPIHAVVCVGRVLQEERLADGRYNLLLRGLSRARVREEVAVGKMYRVARVYLLAEVPVAADEGGLRGELGRQLDGWFADQPEAGE